jgi:hypothetical protein
MTCIVHAGRSALVKFKGQMHFNIITPTVCVPGSLGLACVMLGECRPSGSLNVTAE